MSESQAPDWLKEDFFHNILRKSFDSCKIKSLQIEEAVPKKMRFTSEMFRVKIGLRCEKDAKEFTKNFIVKTYDPQDDSQKLHVDTLCLFPREIYMYSTIIKEFEDIFIKAGENVKFAPTCYKIVQNPATFVLEDLRAEDFNLMAGGLGREHLKAVISKLAKFHAVSAVFRERNNSYSEIFSERKSTHSEIFKSGLFREENRGYFQNYLKVVKPSYISAMAEWGMDQYYIDKVEKLLSTMFDKMLQLITCDEQSGFQVLCHGDVWIYNIMFQHSNQKTINEILFLDFQNCMWMSPAYDLNFFLVSSSNEKCRTRDFDYMIEFYHKELVEVLKFLGYTKSIPKLSDIQQQIVKYGHIAMFASISSLLSTLLPSDIEPTLEGFLGNNDESEKFRMMAFLNPKYVATLKALLPFFDQKGLLD